MRPPLPPERQITLALIVGVCVQGIAVLIWIGAAVERLDVLEAAARESAIDHVKLAKLETQLELIHRQLDRIEARLEATP